MLPWLEDFSCREKLDGLELFSLQNWRLWGDLREIYKIMRIIDRVASQNLFADGNIK